MKMKTQLNKNVWNLVQALLTRKFITLTVYIRQKKDLKSVVSAFTLGN